MSESSQSTSSKRPREADARASSDAQTKAKKTRSDATELVHDEEFWYEDGTIILVARNVEFRVYKGILADHSSVFADMFSFPQPTPLPSHTAPPECPSVNLEDSPEDLRHILRALFPKKSATFVLDSDAEPHTFHAISAYIRLGHKYQMDTLLDQALSYLKKCFTTDFDARQKWLKNNTNQIPRGWGVHVTSKVYAIGVVNLARLTQCDTILPSALAVCCCLSGEQLVDGFLREDGTRERLSVDDLKTCISGMRVMTHAASAAVTKALSIDCKAKQECQDAIQELRSDHADETLFFPTSSPFQHWDGYMTTWWTDYGACGGCLAKVKKRFRAEQRSMWAELPFIFGMSVEGWPENET